MPRGDGTGPRGMGPMTGRAAGYCAGSNVPGFANPAPGGGYGGGYGRGYGRGMGGWGRGYGWGRGAPGGYAGYPPPIAYQWGAVAPPGVPGVDETTALTQQKEALEAQLAGISERLQALEGAQQE